jgi:hypothetical protein
LLKIAAILGPAQMMVRLTDMRGDERVPQDHPLRAVRKLTDAVLRTLSPEFDALYAESGRPPRTAFQTEFERREIKIIRKDAASTKCAVVPAIYRTMTCGCISAWETAATLRALPYAGPAD